MEGPGDAGNLTFLLASSAALSSPLTLVSFASCRSVVDTYVL